MVQLIEFEGDEIEEIYFQKGDLVYDECDDYGIVINNSSPYDQLRCIWYNDIGFQLLIGDTYNDSIAHEDRNSIKSYLPVEKQNRLIQMKIQKQLKELENHE